MLPAFKGKRKDVRIPPLMLLTLVALFFFSFSSVSGTPYVIDLYTSNSSQPTFNTDPPSFRASGATCTVDITQYLTLASSSNFDVTAQWLSPDNINLNTGSLTSIPSLSCANLGTIGTTNVGTNNNYEARGRITQTSTSGGFNKVKARYTCTQPSNRVELVINRTDPQMDSKGRMPYLLYEHNQTTLGTTPFLTYSELLAGYSQCSNVFNNIPISNFSSGSNTCPALTASWCTTDHVIPFNSSSGDVNIFVNLTGAFSCSGGAGSQNVTYSVDLVKSTDMSFLTLYYRNFGQCNPSGSVGFDTINTPLTLTPNTLYFLVFKGQSRLKTLASEAYLSETPRYINISINTLQGDFICGDYSACDNGLKSRVCVDQLGLFENRTEYEQCINLQPYESLSLGFETDGNTYDYLDASIANFTGLNLGACIPQKFTGRLPQGWGWDTRRMLNFTGGSDALVNDSVYGMILDGAYGEFVLGGYNNTERAYQLNYLPPRIDAITDTGGVPPTYCSEATFGYIPTLNTTALGAEITSNGFHFPTNTTVIRFAVKKASSPHVVYDYTWGVNVFGFNVTFYHKDLCYSSSCSDTPDGTYKVVLFGPSGNIAWDYEGEATDVWTPQILSLSQDPDIQLGVNYTLSLFVGPLNNPQSTQGHAVIFDEIKLENLGSELTCDVQTEQCLGTSRIIGIRSEDGTCVFTEYLNDTACTQEFLGTTTQVDLTNTDAIKPVSDLLSSIGLNQTALEQQNLGFITGFFSPIFIVIMITLIFSGFLEYKTKTGGTVFGLSTLALSLLFLSLGIIDPFFGIMMVILGGFIVAYAILKAVQGG